MNFPFRRKSLSGFRHRRHAIEIAAELPTKESAAGGRTLRLEGRRQRRIADRPLMIRLATNRHRRPAAIAANRAAGQDILSDQ